MGNGYSPFSEAVNCNLSDLAIHLKIWESNSESYPIVLKLDPIERNKTKVKYEPI